MTIINFNQYVDRIKQLNIDLSLIDPTIDGYLTETGGIEFFDVETEDHLFYFSSDMIENILSTDYNILSDSIKSILPLIKLIYEAN